MSSAIKIHTKIYKNCPECKSNKIVKNGSRNGIQRYKCKNCDYQFQSQRQNSRLAIKLAQKYLFKKTV